MKRLAICVCIVLGWSFASVMIGTPLLARSKNTGELAFAIMWGVTMLCCAALGGLGCAGVYREERHHK